MTVTENLPITTVLKPPTNISDKLFTWLETDGEGAVIDDLKPTGNENVEMLREVLAYAKREIGLGNFHMDDWIAINGQGYPETDSGVVVAAQKPLDCNTTVCFAGTAVLFDLKLNEGMGSFGRVRVDQNGRWSGIPLDEEYPEDAGLSYEEDGRRVLGLTQDQADILFYLPNDISLIHEVVSILVGDIKIRD